MKDPKAPKGRLSQYQSKNHYLGIVSRATSYFIAGAFQHALK